MMPDAKGVAHDLFNWFSVSALEKLWYEPEAMCFGLSVCCYGGVEKSKTILRKRKNLKI